MFIRASSASRALACPGSVGLSDKAPKRESFSYPREEGTAAHTLLEWCHRLDTTPDTFKGESIVVQGHPFEVADEMIAGVQAFLTWESEQDFSTSILQFEKSRKLGEWASGTVDFAAIDSKNKTAVVADFKYGANVSVDVNNNAQLLSYAMLIADDYSEIETFRCLIIQPRAYDTPQETSFTWGEVNAHREALQRVHQENVDGVAEFAVGSQCNWCPAISICQEQKNLAAKAFDMISEPAEGGVVTPEQLIFALDNLKPIVKHLEALQDAALDYVKQGNKLEGYKTVRANSRRRWKDASMTEADLRDAGFFKKDIYEAKLLSPAKIEKLEPPKKTPTKGEVKKLVATLTEKPPGAIVLAPDSDKRTEVDADPAALFGKIK